MATKRKVVARRRSQFHGDEDQPASSAVTWWASQTPEDCAEQAWSWCDRVRSSHRADAAMDLIHDAIYRGRPVGDNGFGQQYLLLKSGVVINLNIVMSIVDTANARFTKRRPFPVISADNAGWTEKGFAEEASRVLRRKLAIPQLERENPLVIGDMLRRGDGCMKAYIEDGDVAYKRIPIYEVLADPFEAEIGNIRTWAHVRPEPRDVMMARYPAFREQIAAAQTYRASDMLFASQHQTVSDTIEVRELWHLPTSPQADDGLHVETIRGQVVHSRQWRHPRPPIQRCRWSVIPRMFRGGGLVEQLIGIQEQINDILKDAREGLKFGSQLTVFMQRGAQINKNHLRGRGPKVVEFDGQEPHYIAPNPVSEQAIRILMLLIEQAYQISGISQMAAQSKNPLGANASGKAIDSMDDLQSERFAHVEADYQQYRVLLGATTIDLAQDIADETKGKLKPYFDQDEDVLEEAATWIEEIEWPKVDIDSGSYHLVLEPLNYLADSRAGRLSQVAELSKNGLITNPAIQADLFNEPDLQRANRMLLGPKHKLDRIMSDLANPKVDMYELAPDQYTNLDLGLEMALGELNEAESMPNPPPAILDRYRTWIELAKEQKKLRETPAPGAAAGPPQGAPPLADPAALGAGGLPSALGPGAPIVGAPPPPVAGPMAMPQMPLPVAPLPGMPPGS
jgi:hypothetical protein